MLLEEALQLARLDVGLEASAQIDRRRLAQRHHGGRHRDVVREHDRVLALRERHVEEPERHHDSLNLSGQPAGLEAHAVADAERPRAEEQHARQHVAEGVLRGQADDHGGERTADRERPRVESRSAQRHEQRDCKQDQPDEEADRAGGRGVEAIEQRRTEGATDVAGEPPAERDQGDGTREAHRLVDAEQLDAVAVREVDEDDEWRDEQDLLARPGGVLPDLRRRRRTQLRDCLDGPRVADRLHGAPVAAEEPHSPLTSMRKAAVVVAPGSTTGIAPVTSAFVGAVIGSKQIRDWPPGAYTWA
ncbi:MAG: hypothetical protein QOH76_77 [Thermoleophilaceae bacterium]|nr:hypothetical protein [Thermoleophilaceae bacterium]